MIRKLIIFTCSLLCVFVLFTNQYANGQEIQGKLERLEELDNQGFGQIRHVLIINAYHQGFQWTDNQTQAIIDQLKNYDENILISVEYLDWKNYPTIENLEYHYQIMKYKYEDDQIDVIIGTDDLGMQFAIDYRDEIFDSAPLVFTAVFEDSAVERMEGVSDITGVYEVIDPEGSIEMMLDFEPNIENVYIIRDNSESAKHFDQELRNAFLITAPDINLISLNDKTFDEIRAIIKEPLDNSAVFIGSYNSDSAGVQLSNEIYCYEFTEMSEMSFYSVYEYLYGNGIVGGSLLKGYKQGEEGAKLAIKILEGADPDLLPPVIGKTVELSVDYNVMSRHGLELRALSVNASTVINEPDSVFTKYKAELVTIFGIIGMLVFLVIFLMLNTRRRKKTETELIDLNMALKITNDSLSKSEIKLKLQNDELQVKRERINFLAYNDYLTGLPNRLEIKRYSDIMMDKVNEEGKKLMVAFIDLDNFKYINTSYGHKAGDVILEQVSGRFDSMTSRKCKIGRIGGDEFVCLAMISNEEECDVYIERLNKLFVGHFTILGQDLYMSASIGYSVYPHDGLTYDDLLIRSDMAMFKMKEQGKSQAGRYDLVMDKVMNRKIRIISELHDAIINGEFHMVYQPQYNVKEDRVIGYEALIRWENDDLGIVGPDEFIPIAESAGLIVPIGEWVLKEAIYFTKVLTQSDIKGFSMAINISVVQLMQKNFAQRIKEILDEIAVDPRYLEFEITESVFIESFDVAKEQINKIREMGIQIALDDFGTGYSSLTYLKNIPMSTLKIDKAFIDDILLEGEEHFFTESIIDIGHKLGYKIVAEGVETEIQKQYLLKHECNIMQGYYFNKPMSREDAIDLYRSFNEEEPLDA